VDEGSLEDLERRSEGIVGEGGGTLRSTIIGLYITIFRWIGVPNSVYDGEMRRGRREGMRAVTLSNVIDESLNRFTIPNTTPLITSGSFADLYGSLYGAGSVDS
jgi:hypothetical protein